MAVASTFIYVIKHPGARAEPVMVDGEVNFDDEAYRVIASAEGHPRGRGLCRGDKAYPAQFGKPDLWVMFDGEFLHFPMRPNRWGIKGLIVITRVEDNRFVSLRPDEADGIISDLEQEIGKDPHDPEQMFKDLGKYF